MNQKLIAEVMVLIVVILPTAWSQSIQKKKKESAYLGYTLTGNLKNAENKKIYLFEKSFFKEDNKTDSTISDKNGNFVFKGIVSEPTYYFLQTSVNNDGVSFYIENVKMQIRGNADSLRFALVTGSKEEDIRKQYDQVAMSFDYTGVGQQYIDAENRKDTVAMNLAKLKEAALVEKEKLGRAKLIRKYPFATATANTQLASLIEVHEQSDFAKADSLLKIYESSPVANTGQVKYFRKQLDNNMILVVGRMAPDFTQTDTNGNPVRLLDFRGKYVLLDFWASWCGPCRQESPNLVKVYQEFKDKNFTILSVSLDSNKGKWLKAVADDHLSWTQLSDLKYWKNEIAQKYSVSAIPFNFLIDPDGQIVGVNLKGEKLAESLKILIK